jgi:hypothetical protein
LLTQQQQTTTTTQQTLTKGTGLGHQTLHTTEHA